MKKAIDESQRPWEEIYLSRLKDFGSYYLQLVIFTAAAIAVGIVVAVISNVLLGMALVLLSVCVYAWFSSDEAYKQLGIRFSNAEGRIIIKKLDAAYGECLAVPARLIWADVTSIGDGALSSEKNSELLRVYLPRSIEHIGKDVFGDTNVALTICYEGTAEEWKEVENLTDISSCEIIFECEQPTLPQKMKKVRGRIDSDGEAAE